MTHLWFLDVSLQHPGGYNAPKLMTNEVNVSSTQERWTLDDITALFDGVLVNVIKPV